MVGRRSQPIPRPKSPFHPGNQVPMQRTTRVPPAAAAATVRPSAGREANVPGGFQRAGGQIVAPTVNRAAASSAAAPHYAPAPAPQLPGGALNGQPPPQAGPSQGQYPAHAPRRGQSSPARKRRLRNGGDHALKRARQNGRGVGLGNGHGNGYGNGYGNGHGNGHGNQQDELSRLQEECHRMVDYVRTMGDGVAFSLYKEMETMWTTKYWKDAAQGAPFMPGLPAVVPAYPGGPMVPVGYVAPGGMPMGVMPVGGVHPGAIPPGLVPPVPMAPGGAPPGMMPSQMMHPGAGPVGGVDTPGFSSPPVSRGAERKSGGTVIAQGRVGEPGSEVVGFSEEPVDLDGDFGGAERMADSPPVEVAPKKADIEEVDLVDSGPEGEGGDFFGSDEVAVEEDAHGLSFHDDDEIEDVTVPKEEEVSFFEDKFECPELVPAVVMNKVQGDIQARFARFRTLKELAPPVQIMGLSEGPTDALRFLRMLSDAPVNREAPTYGCILKDAFGEEYRRSLMKFCNQFFDDKDAKEVRVLIVAPDDHWIDDLHHELGEVSTSIRFSVFKERGLVDTADKIELIAEELEAWCGVMIMCLETFMFCVQNAARTRKHLINPGPDVMFFGSAHGMRSLPMTVLRQLRRVRTKLRFAITCAPLFNNLVEYWYMADWAMPGVLGTMDEFAETFLQTIAVGYSEEAEDEERKLAASASCILWTVVEMMSMSIGNPPAFDVQGSIDIFVQLHPTHLECYNAVVKAVKKAVVDGDFLDPCIAAQILEVAATSTVALESLLKLGVQQAKMLDDSQSVPELGTTGAVGQKVEEQVKRGAQQNGGQREGDKAEEKIVQLGATQDKHGAGPSTLPPPEDSGADVGFPEASGQPAEQAAKPPGEQAAAQSGEHAATPQPAGTAVAQAAGTAAAQPAGPAGAQVGGYAAVLPTEQVVSHPVVAQLARAREFCRGLLEDVRKVAAKAKMFAGYSSKLRVIRSIAAKCLALNDNMLVVTGSKHTFDVVTENLKEGSEWTVFSIDADTSSVVIQETCIEWETTAARDGGAIMVISLGHGTKHVEVGGWQISKVSQICIVDCGWSAGVLPQILPRLADKIPGGPVVYNLIGNDTIDVYWLRCQSTGDLNSEETDPLVTRICDLDVARSLAAALSPQTRAGLNESAPEGMVEDLLEWDEQVGVGVMAELCKLQFDPPDDTRYVIQGASASAQQRSLGPNSLMCARGLRSVCRRIGVMDSACRGFHDVRLRYAQRASNTLWRHVENRPRRSDGVDAQVRAMARRQAELWFRTDREAALCAAAEFYHGMRAQYDVFRRDSCRAVDRHADGR